MGSVSDCSCFSWATTSVLFSLRADTRRIKKDISYGNIINRHVHGLDLWTENVVKLSLLLNQFWIEWVVFSRSPLWCLSRNINFIAWIYACYLWRSRGEQRTSKKVSTLTLGNFLVRIKISVHIHGKVHHVCVTEEVQFSLKQLLLIVDLRTRQVYRTKNKRGEVVIFVHCLTKWLSQI